MNARAQSTTLWMPIWYDAGREIDGLWCSCTHYGAALTDKRKAWAEARRMCDAIGGIGFCVRRVEPVIREGASTNAPHELRRISNA